MMSPKMIRHWKQCERLHGRSYEWDVPYCTKSGVLLLRPISFLTVEQDDDFRISRLVINSKQSDKLVLGHRGIYDEDDGGSNDGDGATVDIHCPLQYFTKIAIQWSRDGYIKFMSFEQRDECRNREIGICSDDEWDEYGLEAAGKLLITGVFFNDEAQCHSQRGFVRPVALQLVDLGQAEGAQAQSEFIESSELLNVFQMPSRHGLHSIKNKAHQLILNGVIGVGNGCVLAAFMRILETRPKVADAQWKATEYIEILEKCIEGDLGAIHSVLALQRFIKSMIFDNCAEQGLALQSFAKLQNLNMNQENLRKWHLDDAERGIQPKSLQAVFEELDGVGEEKLMMMDASKKREVTHCRLQSVLMAKILWDPLNAMAERAKRMSSIQGKLDVFAVTFLAPTKSNYALSALTLGAQSGMTGLLAMSAMRTWEEGVSGDAIILASALCVGVIVGVLATKQILGVLRFFAAFSASHRWLAIGMGVVSNIIIAAMMVPLSLVVVAGSERNLDVILFAMAILFVLRVRMNGNAARARRKESLRFASLLWLILLCVWRCCSWWASSESRTSLF